MANDGATATSGVSEETDAQHTQQFDTERMDLMDQLAESSHQTVLDEVEEAISEGIQPVEEGDTETTDESTGQESGETDDPLIPIKIDGVESEVPLSTLTANYQKGSAADQRLEQAAAERVELEKLQQELREEVARHQVPDPPSVEQPPSVSVTDADSLATAFDDLTVGSESEKVAAATTIRELLGRGDNPATQADTAETTEMIVSKAVQQATVQMQYDMAKARFEQDYQDIANDATLNQMVMTTLGQVAGESKTYEEAFGKAVDQVVTWRDGLVAKLTSTPANNGQSGTPSRVDAKNALTPEVKSVKTKAVKPAEIPETASDIVREMQAARGQ